jgi:hypothetical protein
MPLDIPSSRATTHPRVGVGVSSMKYSSICRIGRRRNAVLFLVTIRVAAGPAARVGSVTQHPGDELVRATLAGE